MTPQRLRTKLRKIREAGEAAAEEGGELNIIPYLDIVVNIIMFMLATTAFSAALGDINIAQPNAGVSAGTADEAPKNDLNLTLAITDKGFIIAASGAVLHQGYSFGADGTLNNTTVEGPTIPKKGPGVNDYDYDLLNKKMLEIKASPVAANETKLIVNPNENITYDVIVAALDAARGQLITKPDPANPGKMLESFQGFPDVLFSAGVN
ncbi:MAG: biopolymer transporter ExbD [Polyangia bacterium]